MQVREILETRQIQIPDISIGRKEILSKFILISEKFRLFVNELLKRSLRGEVQPASSTQQALGRVSKCHSGFSDARRIGRIDYSRNGSSCGQILSSGPEDLHDFFAADRRGSISHQSLVTCNYVLR